MRVTDSPRDGTMNLKFIKNNFYINLKTYLVEDLNLNLLDHRTNTKVKDYLNLNFHNLLIPVINMPTRITETNITLIDHILTNDFLNIDSSTGIVQIDISHHFPIFSIMSTEFFNNIPK